jgi:phosphohistidine phosphatase SixA
MTVYIVRHALAVPRKRWTGADDDRPLTARGGDQATVLTAWAKTVSLDSIMSSPARRCVATVEAVANALDRPLVRTADLGLSDPSRGVDLVADLLSGTTDVMVCTHGEVVWPILRSLGLTSGAGGSKGAAKGSVWIVTMVDDRPAGTYLTTRDLSRLLADVA